MKSVFPDYIQVASQGLDLRLERQNVVAGNLANISNPEYQPRRLDFEEEMQAALEIQDQGSVSKTSPAHMPAGFEPDGVQGSLSKEPRIRVIQGQDGADLDQEMAIQNKNTLQYNTLALVLQKSFSGLQDVISKGGQ
ncbi:MAG: flagellar basal body rod protein FlgB [Desulfohalobiaceae bacterium]